MKLTVEGLEKERDFYFGQSAFNFCWDWVLYKWRQLPKMSHILVSRQAQRRRGHVSREWSRGRRYHQKGWQLPQECFFSNLMYLTSPRFWTFFTRQKMVLLCLMRRMCPRLLRGRRSTSVPLKARYSRTCLSSMLLAYVWHYPSCVCYLARCTKQRLKLDSSWMCNSRM